MAWDFTLSTGNKTGASRRTSGAQFERGSSKVNQTHTSQARTVMADVGNDPLIKAAHTMGDFFGQASAKETEAMIDKEKERNKEAIIEAQRRVLADPEGAAEAVRTGDYSKFIDDDELRSRKVVQEGFLTNAAEQAAQQAWEHEGQQFVANLPADANVDEAYQQWLAQRVEGTSPVYTDAFMAQGYKAGQKGITNFKNQRYKHMVEQSTLKAQGLADQLFKQTDLPKDPTAIEGKIISAFAGTMVPAPLQSSLARAAAAKAAMRNINNPAAYTYATTVPIDPSDPTSLTIAEYYETNGLGSVAVWQNKALTSKRNDIDANANDELSNLEVLSTTNPTMAYEGVERMVRNKSVHPLNERVLRLKTQLAKIMKDGRGASIWLQVQRDPTLLDRLSEDDRKEYEKYNNSMPADQREALAGQLGVPHSQAARAQALTRKRGMAPKAETKRSADNILTGNEQTFLQEMKTFQKYRDMSGGNGQEYYGSDPAGKKALMLSRVADANPALAISMRQKINDFTGNIHQPWNREGDKSTHKTSRDMFKAVEDKHSYMKKFAVGLREQAYGVLAAAYIATGGDMDRVKEIMTETFPEESMAVTQTSKGTFSYDDPVNLGAKQYTEEELQAANDHIDAVHQDFQHPGNPDLYVHGDDGILGGKKLYNDATSMPLTYGGNSVRQRLRYEKGQMPPKEIQAISDKTDNPDGSTTWVVKGAPKAGKPLIHKGEKDIYAAWNGKTWEMVWSETDLLKEQKMQGPYSKRLVQYLEEQRGLQSELQKLEKDGIADDKGTPEDFNSAFERMKQVNKRMAKGKTGEVARIKEALGKTTSNIERIVSLQGSTNSMILSTLKKYTAAFGDGPITTKLMNQLETEADPRVVGKDADDEAQKSVEVVLDATQGDKEQQQLKNHDFHKDPDFTYDKNIEPFLIEHEGLTELAYTDTTKATSVGAGFNLDDKITAGIIEKEGYNVQSLKDKEQTMSKAEGRRILKIIYKDKRERLIKHIGDKDWVKLSDYEQLALVSLFYNSEAAGGGKRLTSAVRGLADARREKDAEKEQFALQAIDREIRYRSLPYKKMITEGNARYIDALWYRRNSEADMFLQGRVKNEKGDIQFPLRKNNWREDPEAVALMWRHQTENKKTWPKFDPRQILNTKRETRKTKMR